MILAFAALLVYFLFMALKLHLRLTGRISSAMHIFIAILAVYSYSLLLPGSMLLGLASIPGFFLLAAGLMLVLVAIMSIRMQAFHPGKKLIATGVYAYIRNPMYSGVLLSCYGSAILAPSIPVIVYAVLLTCVLFSISLLEERELAARFGRRYLDYRNSVGRFVPRKLVSG